MDPPERRKWIRSKAPPKLVFTPAVVPFARVLGGLAGAVAGAGVGQLIRVRIRDSDGKSDEQPIPVDAPRRAFEDFCREVIQGCAAEFLHLAEPEKKALEAAVHKSEAGVGARQEAEAAVEALTAAVEQLRALDLS